jgi:outer membrane lipoprotein-sorting protein
VKERLELKRAILPVLVAILLMAAAFGQSKPGLDQVLALLDRASGSFKSVQTDFVWDQYQKVVDEHDVQKGVMYFKRSGNNTDVAADIQSPPPGKKLVVKNGAAQVFTRKTGQTTTYDAAKNRESFESFLALGFGGHSSDLTKNFQVRYAGTEPVNGVQTYKLELTPKSDKVKQMFPLITLWINQQTGMSEKQRLDQGEGDYRVATFSNTTLNQPLPEGVFRLK